MISVPIIRSGAIQGYVMAQFSFTANAAILKRLSLKADVVLLDEAFKAIYSEEVLDFKNMKKQDLGGLVKRIVEGSNQRFGDAHRRRRLYPGTHLCHQRGREIGRPPRHVTYVP